MSTEAQHGHAQPGYGVQHFHEENTIHMPAPTQWPLIMAVGLTLIFAGLVTNFMITALGFVMTIAGAVGWFRQVLPHEAHELLPVSDEEIEIEREGRRVMRVEHVMHPASGRAMTPVHLHTISSGIKGGFAGGTVMIVLAEIYGVVRFHSIWYVVNLLGGAGVAGWTNPTESELRHFHLAAFLIAIVIHTASSFLVGLLYGALLPILPRHPIVLGGLIAPALWTGLLHSILGLLNPYFDDHINWYWFALSQVGYGLVAGYVVSRSEHFKSLAGVPLSVRMGVERPEPPKQDDEGRR